MAPGNDTKLPLTSRDVHAERLAQFCELFPEAFTEGKTDLKKLAQLLGDAATDAPERYGLSWSGKSEAIRAIQITSPGTLRPSPEESWPPLPFAAADPGSSGRESAPSQKPGSQSRLTSAATDREAPSANTSGNLVIEGDNLETLKLLQGGYHGRVKMIYIDPPYNTGGEFIYPDNYKEGLAICLERPLAQETLRGLVARKPKGVICLDIAFAGNDQLKALDERTDIKLFFRLPDWFKVETPLGTYNPDWAIVKEEQAGGNKLYLVRETKGTTQFLKLPEMQRRKIKCGEARFKCCRSQARR